MTPRAIRWFLFSLVPLTVAISAAMLMWKTQPSGCAGYGYASGDGITLAYCARPSYGDYESGMLIFGISPREDAAARAADVVVLGYSHAHVGFSTAATERHAASMGSRLHNLSLSGSFSAHADIVLDRLQIRPKVWVIDVDPFFVPPYPEFRGSANLNRLMERPLRETAEHAARRLWQPIHRMACAGQILPSLCGSTFAYFRRPEDGRIIVDYHYAFGPTLGEFPVPPDGPVNAARVPGLATLASEFLRRHDMDRTCTIFTVVPANGQNARLAAATAEVVGAPYVNPEVPGLVTIDRAHLHAESAERWSDAFWAAARPIIERCAGRTS
ncbi:hypothetical protein GXW71_28185 [Roseomonas hellenica]|uniref:Uncharacterized protein n=1 Tax=Plastoroseomonas hellenica TaxID=2687306 RepID=A0ABS5F6T1_9PROT|nr:hypothetical protein [Plastoroseomonas hellenica]MBR0668264.1 hypothetical protein [Plastoroseomonas hellenica]